MNTKLTKSESILGILLIVIFILGLLGLIFVISFYSIVPNKPSIFMLISFICAYCCALAIVHELIKIHDTVDVVICKTPFIMENVKSMQKIAVYLFIISGYVFIKDWLNFKVHIFAFTFDNSGINTDAECLIFVLLGLFVLIIAKIFKTAIEIKNENDLTV